MPGYDVACSTRAASRCPPARSARSRSNCRCRPGCLPTLWHADERFARAISTTFPGYYQTADAGFIDADGYIHVMARTDDIINVAGHRLSTGGDGGGAGGPSRRRRMRGDRRRRRAEGRGALGFVVLKAGVARDPAEIERELVALVRERIGPVAAFKLALTVQRLPKTRSGKILRGTMKQDRRRRGLDHAGDDRRPGRPRRDRREPEGAGDRGGVGRARPRRDGKPRAELGEGQA